MNFNYFICSSIESKDLDNIVFECSYIANVVQRKKKFESDLIHCIYRNESRNTSVVFYIDLKGKSLYMGMVVNDSEKIINNNTTEKDIYVSLEQLSDKDIDNISRVLHIAKNNLEKEDIDVFNKMFILALNNKFKNNEFIIDYRLLDDKAIKFENFKEEIKRIIDKYIL